VEKVVVLEVSRIRDLADNNRADSKASQFRRKRSEFFRGLLTNVPRPVRLLDVGGTQEYWEQMGFGNDSDLEITLLNLEPRPIGKYRQVIGDARDMSQFVDREFDVVFSNSVIEHVGAWTDQLSMANEVRRVGKRYYVQTPNRYFPIEPHFLFPLFQFFPVFLRVSLHCNFTLGWMRRASSREEATKAVESIRLLSTAQMKRLFPEAEIYSEEFLGLTKSITAYGGFHAEGFNSGNQHELVI
jgi:SAM-dependent methyltransferase